MQFPRERVQAYSTQCKQQANDVKGVADKFGDAAKINPMAFTTWMDAIEMATTIPISLGLFPVIMNLKSHRWDFPAEYEKARSATVKRLTTISNTLNKYSDTLGKSASGVTTTDQNNASGIAAAGPGGSSGVAPVGKLSPCPCAQSIDSCVETSESKVGARGPYR